MNLLNATGAEFRSDLNNALPAIASQHSGATNPATTYPYQRIARTDLGVLMRRNAANTANILDGALAETLVVAKSAAFTAVLADHGRSFVCTNSFTLSLAAAVTLGDGWRCEIINNGAGNITLDPNAAELVDGAATLLVKPGQSCLLVCNGVGFYTVGLAWAQWVQPGQVSFFAQSAAPAGWVKANGALLSRTVYLNLFAAIGTVFGAGDGSTTFGIPDLRGEFIRGWDDARGVDAGRVFGSTQLDALQNITGALNPMRATLGVTMVGSGAFQAAGTTAFNDANSGAAGYYNVTFDASRVVRTATETRPRNVALLACIKF